jgi:hypothetical protein
VVAYTTFTWDDSDDDLVGNYKFCVKNINNLNDETEIRTFLSNLESPIHGSSSQKEIIGRLENKILEFELNVQSYESKLQNLKNNCQMHLGELITLKVKV